QPQKGLSRSERHSNVRGAFAVSPRAQASIKDKNVMLVDDVFTSGATLNECARVLKRAGAAKVYVVTLARVTREEF
ncbi:MAG TPA: amidophosphoribosyltransferase, partial [Rhodospirillaceae bacterium]|nr:amidophosphoribosyltransferase [Rhodospirillaceae bacterium]